ESGPPGAPAATSSRYTHTSYSSQVTSVLPIQNGATATTRGPAGESSVTVPPGTGTISNVTSVGGIESRYGTGRAAAWPRADPAHAASSGARVRLVAMSSLRLVSVALMAAALSARPAPGQAGRGLYAGLHMGVGAGVESVASVS